jgi:hypothetical protein
MEGIRVLRSTQIIILGICFAFATIVSAIILSQAFIKIKTFTVEVISVTGSASKDITSDYIVWNASFSRRDPQMVNAYARLKEDLGTVTEYLVSKGIKKDEIIISQVDTSKIYKQDENANETNEIEAYRLVQGVEVRSNDVGKVAEVSRKSTQLIENGIEFESQSPKYFYTKLAELKHEMLSLASADARKRAEEIVSSTNSKVGVVRNAQMGVFQITPVNSYDVSGYGECDTSSLEKKITAVVRAEFAIVPPPK